MTQVRLQFNTFYFVCCLPTLAFRLMPLWVQCLLFMYGIQKCQSYKGASATLTLNLSAREQVGWTFFDIGMASSLHELLVVLLISQTCKCPCLDSPSIGIEPF